jgi:hypothetical protein
MFSVSGFSLEAIAENKYNYAHFVVLLEMGRK